jgi:hypothetical protein
VPNDPDLYSVFIWDHASLTETTKLYNTKLEAIKALSTTNMEIRNFYGSSVVLIQQQSALAENIESQKFRQSRPTLDNLEYNKSTAFDVDYCLSLYSPARSGIAEYEGYDISVLKDRFRELRILAGRWGGIGSWCPLYFDGAVNHFKELPLPKTTELIEFYNKVKQIK